MANVKLADYANAKADIGLGNVDNTSDADKPVSTATAAALAGPISYSAGTNSVPYRLVGADLSENASNFNLSVHTFPGVNLPAGDARENNVVNIGWNVGPNGTRENPDEAMLRIAFEEHFKQAGSPAAFEWHLSSMDEAGVEHRPISSYLHKDGSPGSDISLNVDFLVFKDYNYNQQIKYDFLTGKIFHRAGLFFEFDANNSPVARQVNAAGDGFVNLPYIDAANSIRCQAPVVTAGPAPTTGGYVGEFAVFQCTSLPHNGTVLTLESPGGVANHDIIRAQGYCQGELRSCVWNNSNAANGHAVLNLRTLSATAGDSFVRYSVNDLQDWAVGLDNSDADAFVWSSWSPGSENRMRLGTDGTLSLPKAGSGLRVKEGENCKQGVVTLVGGTATVANTSITANSRIMLTGQSDNGGSPGSLRVSARTSGASFTITSLSLTDTSVVAYQIFEPA